MLEQTSQLDFTASYCCCKCNSYCNYDTDNAL